MDMKAGKLPFTVPQRESTKSLTQKKLLFSQFHAKILQAYVENHDAMQFYCHQP
ncbi:hypothetical protein [Delftia acidovorans]|uniref:hypothetical protein n=1 Tax=Delftia acidovorans TaxID=80866 RepID=UPI0028AA8BAC|nr:hypothetical protein [Delftia acidovorans]